MIKKIFFLYKWRNNKKIDEINKFSTRNELMQFLLEKWLDEQLEDGDPFYKNVNRYFKIQNDNINLLIDLVKDIKIDILKNNKNKIDEKR